MTASTWSKSNFTNKRFNNERIQLERVISKLKDQINRVSKRTWEERMQEITTIINNDMKEIRGSDLKLIELEVKKFGFEIDLINYILMECKAGMAINEEESTEKLASQL